MNFDRAMTGMILPRKEMTPSTPTGIFGVLVILGVCETSLTLRTLIPKISRVPKVKKENFHFVGASEFGPCINTVEQIAGLAIVGHAVSPIECFELFWLLTQQVLGNHFR